MLILVKTFNHPSLSWCWGSQRVGARAGFQHPASGRVGLSELGVAGVRALVAASRPQGVPGEDGHCRNSKLCKSLLAKTFNLGTRAPHQNHTHSLPPDGRRGAARTTQNNMKGGPPPSFGRPSHTRADRNPSSPGRPPRGGHPAMTPARRTPATSNSNNTFVVDSYSICVIQVIA